MRGYTVKQVAKLSGVSVRALHHYDEVGLLKPACVGPNGYRYYGKDELLRLQQILFHRELGFPLDEIRQVLDAPDFDRLAALRRHRERLATEAKRYRALVATIDQTLAALQGAAKMDDKAMYRGFDPKKQAEHEAWLVERLGERVKPVIAAAQDRVKGMTQAEFDGLMREVEAIEAEMAAAMAQGLPADSAAALAIVRRHHAWVGKSWNALPSAERYVGLAAVYAEHPEFRARYEDRAAGLTEYLGAAMRAFAAAEL
ncbi:MAG TPA: MerR family transcriptional regulator [Phenylobacterium sp.]|nr:MerR family transcriptional regulator [Phenylobacterium sp.]